MARISDLPEADDLTGAETIPLVQDGEMRRGSLASLREITALTALLTQHPASHFIGVAAPAAGAGNNFGSHFALAKVLPALTVLDGLEFYLSTAQTVNLYAATATNVVGGFATGTSVFTLGADIGAEFYGVGLHSFSAADLAALGDLSGKFIVLTGQCEYSSAAGATGDEQWVTINTGTLVADLGQSATRKLELKIIYHTSDDHSGDLLDERLTDESLIAAVENLPGEDISRLKTAVRNYGFFPRPASRAPGANVPVVTIGAANAASILNARAGGNPLILADDARLTWLGGVSRLEAGVGCWTMRGAAYSAVPNRDGSYSSIETEHTGDVIEFCLNNGGAFRLLVDDYVVAEGTVPGGAGDFNYVNFDFPAIEARRIRLEGAGVRIRGVNVVSSGEVAQGTRNYPLVTVIGDSFAEGTGGLPMMGEAITAVRAIGCNPALAAVGGTGLLNEGPVLSPMRLPWTHAERLKDLTLAGVIDARTGLAASPTAGIVMLSVNDGGVAPALWGGAANFDKAISNAVWTQIEAWIAANPGKPLIYFGPTSVHQNVGPSLFRIRDAAQEACSGAARDNVHFVDRLIGGGTVLRGPPYDITETTGATHSNTTINGLASVAGVAAGSLVYGPGIPEGATVVSVDSANSVTIDIAATAAASPVYVQFRNNLSAMYTYWRNNAVDAPDPTHPPPRGHNHDGLWMARELRRIILGELA